MSATPIDEQASDGAPVDLLRCALPEPDATLAERATRPRLKDAALEALSAARAKYNKAGPTLSRWFRDARRLGSKDRPVVAEAVYGIIRHEYFLLRAGARSEEALHQMWCQLMSGERFESMEPATPAEDFATALALPFAFASEWLERLGPVQAAKLARTLSGRAPTTVRANRILCSREELAERLLEEGIPTRPTERAAHGLHLEKRAAMGSLSCFKDGWFELQDEASQLCCEAIERHAALSEGALLVDLCAGAGGKTLALAAAGARVVATDVRQNVLGRLRNRAKRARAEVILDDPCEADVVLIDAPCTGTGRLRRDPALRWGLAPERLGVVQLQQELVDAGGSFVRPGGLLVYATCSLLAAEQQVEPPEDGGWEMLEDQVLWPHMYGTDGFSWRMWQRT